MNELQIVNLEQVDITAWDFERLKEELSKELSVYKTTVYTDETIKSAKDDKATLVKAKKVIEDQRKAYKKECLAPYEAIEPQIKALTSMIEEQRVMIDDIVKDYTNRQKQEKESKVRKYYDKKAFVLGDMADALYPRLLDPKWLNVSTTKAKYEEEVQIAIHKALRDINEIKSINSPFSETLLEKYIETCSLEEVKTKQEELDAAASKAGLNQTAQTTISAQEPPKQEIKADASEGINVKIYPCQSQINQICDFMKAIGVKFEIQ